MSIVARGLGRKAGAVALLVTAGLGLFGGVIDPPIPIPESGGKFGTPLVFPIPKYLRQQLDEDEIIFLVISMALQLNLLNPE